MVKLLEASSGTLGGGLVFFHRGDLPYQLAIFKVLWYRHKGRDPVI